jgi:hypothetical protein
MIFYKTLFKTVKIPLDEITKVEIRIGSFKYTDRFKPTFRLEVHHIKSIKPVIINIKVFPKHGLNLLLNHLGLEGGAPNLIRIRRRNH